MGIFAKVLGGVVGGIVGGPVGAAVGVAIAAGLDSDNESPSAAPSSTPRLSVEATSRVDSEGELCEVKVLQSLPDGCFASFRIVDENFDFAKAAPQFADDDGDFSRIGTLIGGKCSCYIPFGAVRTQAGKSYSLMMQVVRLQDGKARILGWTSFIQALPQVPSWTYERLHLPLIRLYMYIATANGDLSRAAVGTLREICHKALDLDPDSDALRIVLKQAKVDVQGAGFPDVALWAEQAQMRLGELNVPAIANALAVLVKVDGRPSAKQVEALNDVLTALGMKESEWQEFVKAKQLDGADYLQVLELKPGATVEEIKAAFRRLIKKHHPDVHANASPAVQADAQRKTVEIQEAYDALLGGQR